MALQHPHPSAGAIGDRDPTPNPDPDRMYEQQAEQAAQERGRDD